MLVNEAFVIVGDLGYDKTGPVTKVKEVLGPDRLRVGIEHGMQSLVHAAQRSAHEGEAQGGRRDPRGREFQGRDRGSRPAAFG